jgi:hypothetical protein
MTTRTAALRLRGRDGPLHAQLPWPDGEPDAIVVIIDDAAPPAEAPSAVTLRVRCETHHDAQIAIEWTEDHARELGVASGRVIVASAS